MRTRRRRAAQAVVEFALVLPLLAIMIMGIIDFGRGIYTYNGVSQAAREIARSASVHPGSPLGSSAQTAAVIATQRGLVPGIRPGTGGVKFHCEDTSGATVNGDGAGGCAPPDVVRVEVIASFEPVALLGLSGPFQLASSSSNQVQ